MAKKKKKSFDDDEPIKKKKKKARAAEDDDDVAAEDDESDPSKPVRRQDLFVGLSFLSLAFFITAAAFYNQDAEEMALKPFAGPEVTIPALTAVSDKVK